MVSIVTYIKESIETVLYISVSGQPTIYIQENPQSPNIHISSEDSL